MILFLSTCEAFNGTKSRSISSQFYITFQHAKLIIFRKDLRLSEAIVANNYVIELNVNVRGHDGAEKSNFNGKSN